MMHKRYFVLVLCPLMLLACASPDSMSSGMDDTPVMQSPAVAAPFSWTSSGILISPRSDASHDLVSIKDPTVVNYGGQWHIYATTYDRSKGYNMAYLSFSDWSQAGSATWYYMDSNSSLSGYKCAPQVFYFAPQNTWYLIYQTQPPAYSTASTLGPPSNWSAPQTFYNGTPSGLSDPPPWIDFWVICDDTTCYLFFSGDNGNLYRSQTTLSNFPNGFGSVTTVMSMGTYDLFEGASVYKINGQNKYLLLVEAIGSGGRYYKAFTSTVLNGSWTALADSESNPFVGKANVSFPDGAWTEDISHGELIRAGYDQTLTINDGQLQYLYQGSTGSASEYNLIPWRLGLLTQAGGQTTYTLNVSKAGTGSGTVSSSPAGVSCGSTCSASYASGTSVTLTATASSDSTFVSWSGACSGTGSCTVSMNAPQSVTATFNLSGDEPGSCTCPAGCASATSISAPFTKDGAGEFCWVATSLGGYINSWNLDSLDVNGTDLTNTWTSSSSLPAKINGNYYVYYKGSYAWSHFEAK